MRKQRPGEIVAEYVAALQKIAEHCEYSDILNDMLQDRVEEGTIARVDTSTDKPRVSRAHLERGYHSRKDLTLEAETLHAIAVVESTKHRDVSTRSMSATIVGRKGT